MFSYDVYGGILPEAPIHMLRMPPVRPWLGRHGVAWRKDYFKMCRVPTLNL